MTSFNCLVLQLVIQCFGDFGIYPKVTQTFRKIQSVYSVCSGSPLPPFFERLASFCHLLDLYSKGLSSSKIGNPPFVEWWHRLPGRRRHFPTHLAPPRLVLVNGFNGIGTGWSTSGPNFDVIQVGKTHPADPC